MLANRADARGFRTNIWFHGVEFVLCWFEVIWFDMISSTWSFWSPSIECIHLIRKNRVCDIVKGCINIQRTWASKNRQLQKIRKFFFIERILSTLLKYKVFYHSNGKELFYLYSSLVGFVSLSLVGPWALYLSPAISLESHLDQIKRAFGLQISLTQILRINWTLK